MQISPDLIIEWDQCTCSCHSTPPHAIHCFPCCTPCPKCGRNIKDNRMDGHMKAYHKESE